MAVESVESFEEFAWMFQRENEPKKKNQNQNLKMESSAPWVGGLIRDKSCICTNSRRARDAVQGMRNRGFSESSNQTTGPPSLLSYHRPNRLVL